MSYAQWIFIAAALAGIGMWLLLPQRIRGTRAVGVRSRPAHALDREGERHGRLVDDRGMSADREPRRVQLRNVDPDARLGQFKCVPFVEELMYGHLRRNPIRD